MQVSFRTRGGQRHRGPIAKMNPKRAKVECPEEVFLVPYGLLEGRGRGRPILSVRRAPIQRSARWARRRWSVLVE